MSKSFLRRESAGPFGRIAACLVSALVLTFVLAGADPAPVRAQPAPPKFQQKDVADQAAKARAVVFRCDKANGRREIGSLKKTKEGLDTAAKTGFVAGAAEDAKALDTEIQYLERILNACNDRNKVTGVDKQTYGFFAKADADFAGKAVGDAQRAARTCDRDLFKAVIKALRDRAADLRKSFPVGATPAEVEQIPTTFLALEQLARDLEAAEAELFKNCPPEPGKQAHTPPGTTPAKPDAPKATPTGPTPGERPGVPPRPGDPPKAPPRFEGEPVLFIGTGGQFDGVKETTLGTIFVPGNDRPFLRSRGTLSGVSVAAGIGIQHPGMWGLLAPTLGLNGGATESIAFRFGFSRSWASASASTGPGDFAVLTLVQPFSTASVVPFGQADASVRTSKTVYDVRVINRLQLNPMVNVDIGAHYVGREIEQEGTLSSRSLPGLQADQHLKTFDNYIGPVLGAGYRETFNLGDRIPPLIVHVDAWLAPSLRITSGSARQHVVIPGAAAPFNDFAVSTERNRAGVALLGGFNATAKLAITPNIDLGIGGGLVFNTAQSHMVVPVSPTQPTRLDTSFQLSGNVQLKVVFRF